MRLSLGCCIIWKQGARYVNMNVKNTEVFGVLQPSRESVFIYVYIEYMWYTLSVDSIYKKNIELLVILVGNSAEKLPRIYIS